LVVIVDKTTAAGAEMVAGALQEHGRALLVGTRTQGHAKIQTVFPIAGDAMLKITTDRWLTPKGHSVENTGLHPDFVVDTPGAEQAKGSEDRAQDIFVRRALEVIKGQ
jgi:carboxyl-terminal processing protease